MLSAVSYVLVLGFGSLGRVCGWLVHAFRAVLCVTW
jgi:hypothetical protein